MALADTAARGGADWGYALFWVGLLVLFVPIALRLASARVSRQERIGLVVLLGMGAYLIKVLHSPVAFAFGDEFSHWRTANDILSTGSLFNPNPLLVVSPFYPGLEIATTALASVSGLSIYSAGLVIIGAARLLIMLALFLIFEQISGSPRLAGIAALLYTANPNYLFWSAQFAYESLALPLAAFVLYVAVRQARTARRKRAFGVLLVVGSAAVVLTHHLTGFALFGVLALWSLVAYGLTRLRQTPHLPAPYAAALLVLLLAVGWLLLVAPVVFGYLGPVFAGALTDALGLLTGQHGPKQFFHGDASQVSPIWEQAVAFASIALISLSLPAALLQLARHFRGWARYRANAFALTLALASLAFVPATALRLTQNGSETSNRSMEFLFVAMAFVLATAVTYFWLPRRAHPRRTVVFAAFASLLFAGGVIIGMARWARLPGPYLLSGDTRAIQAEGIAAADWTRQSFGAANNITADRTNELLMGSYGEQNMLGGLSWIYFAPLLDNFERAALARAGVRLIVADRRLSTQLPLNGYYFERGEPDALQHRAPLSPALLDKFDSTPFLKRIYDSGNIRIYAFVDPAGGQLPFETATLNAREREAQKPTMAR